MPERLVTQTRGFANRIDTLVRDVLGGKLHNDLIVVTPQGNPAKKAVIESFDSMGNVGAIPLYVRGQQVGGLTLSIHTTLDKTDQYLKVSRSDYALRSIIEKEPLARLEFNVKSHTAPIAHWQFHGERGVFSHWLSHAHSHNKYVTEKPHSLSTLHFPVGGERFRPGIEDFLEFIVRECGVDRQPKWESAINEGREIWRRFQARAVTRDFQTEAAQVLRDLGWDVEPPNGFEVTTHDWPSTNW